MQSATASQSLSCHPWSDLPGEALEGEDSEHGEIKMTWSNLGAGIRGK